MAPHAQDGSGSTSDKFDESLDESPLVHKVVVPPRGSVVKEVGNGLWETFFYDAPVDQFRGQSKRRKSWLGLEFVFPILGWIFTYTPQKFLGDLVAGLTIASLAIPQVAAFCVLKLENSPRNSPGNSDPGPTPQPSSSPLVSRDCVYGCRISVTRRLPECRLSMASVSRFLHLLFR